MQIDVLLYDGCEELEGVTPEPVLDDVFPPSLRIIVTGCPVTDGFTEDASDVEVSAGLTVWVREGDVDPVKLGSPL